MQITQNINTKKFFANVQIISKQFSYEKYNCNHRFRLFF